MLSVVSRPTMINLASVLIPDASPRAKVGLFVTEAWDTVAPSGTLLFPSASPLKPTWSVMSSGSKPEVRDGGMPSVRARGNVKRVVKRTKVVDERILGSITNTSIVGDP